MIFFNIQNGFNYAKGKRKHAHVCVCVCEGLACSVKPGAKETGYIYITILNLMEQQAN
jgi:hypothetical protein